MYVYIYIYMYPLLRLLEVGPPDGLAYIYMCMVCIYNQLSSNEHVCIYVRVYIYIYIYICTCIYVYLI